MNAKTPRRQECRSLVLLILGVLASWRSFIFLAFLITLPLRAQLPSQEQIDKDLQTIYVVHQANPDFSHRGELCHRVEHVLQRQCEYFQMHLLPWQKDPQALLVKDKALYSTGNHLEWSIRTNAQCAMGLATLARAVSDEKAKHDAIAILRFLVPTHHAGGVMCDDGKQWHSQWQSAFWAASMGRAAWLLWDDLDPQMKWLTAKLIEEEADRFVNREPDHQVVSDTKAEENAWNSMVISLAYNMLPNHPHHQLWGETAQRWQVSSWAAQRDLDQNPIVDGKPLKEWIHFPNIYDDYTLENHDRVHPDYMAAIYLSQFQSLHYLWAGNPVPQCTAFNTNKIHASLAQFALPDGSCIYPSGEDWPLHRNADYFDTHTAEAILFNDPIAARLARNSLRAAEKMLARYPQGPIYAAGETRYITTHAADLEGYAQAYLLMSARGEGPAPISEDELWNQLRGRHIFKFGQLGLMRSDHAIATFSWGRQIMGMVMPFRDDMLLTPYDRGLIGDVTVNGKRDVPKPDEINVIDLPNTLAVAGILNRGGGSVEQRFAFIALPDGRSIYVDRATAKPGFAGKIDLGTLGILNDKNWPFHDGKRNVVSEEGSHVFKAQDAGPNSQPISLRSRWINIDGMGVAILSSSGQVYDPRPTKASGRLEQLFHLNEVTSPDQIQPTVLVFYPGQDATATREIAGQCKLSAKNNLSFELVLDDGKEFQIDLENLTITPGSPTAAGATTTGSKLPFIETDIAHHQVHVACESIECKAPLEFFCCKSGTNEHESVLRSKVKPSDLHLALLMVGAEPGQGVHYDEQKKQWIPPTGSKLKITCQYEKDGKKIDVPAEQMMRNLKTKKPMPQTRWVFAGSRVTPQGYAADLTGYLVSIVNFELTVIDVPMLASSDNTTLMWESNPDLVPPKGTKVIMTIQPVAK